LALFETITIAASCFFHSITYLATRKWSGDEVEFVCRKVAGSAARLKPAVRICYFTRGHRASTEWWFPSDPGKAREGKRCLAAVCHHLEGLGDGLGYWSGNGAVCEYFEGHLCGKQVRPKLAGSNEYRDLTSCAFIYSSKTQPDDAVLLDVFGLTREEIEHAREREDIWQFVMRGAARMADFDGTYTVYLYDLWQAEALADMLREGGISGDVTLEPVVEAGILDVARPKPGPVAGARAARNVGLMIGGASRLSAIDSALRRQWLAFCETGADQKPAKVIDLRLRCDLKSRMGAARRRYLMAVPIAHRRGGRCGHGAGITARETLTQPRQGGAVRTARGRRTGGAFFLEGG
jgi:hypothetical protein